MEAGIAQKTNNMYSLGWALQESDSLVFTKMHRNMTYHFSFLYCFSCSVGDLEWELGEDALLLQVSLKVK